VTWRPDIDAATGHLSLPTEPGLGVDLVDEVAAAHPYDENAYLNVWAEGWGRRLGSKGAADAG
jgi:galactonate dehydratase